MAKELGKHDFFGWFMRFRITETLPGPWRSVSAGCFQWVAASGGKLKKGRAKVRVHGPEHRRAEIVARCREICEQLDAGTYVGPKSVTVK